MRMREGFTMVEALVALVLFEVGILALVASAVTVTRDMTTAGRRTHARALASARVETLRAGGCSAPSDGQSSNVPGITEHWRVEVSAAVHVITDSIEYQLPGARRARVVARSWIICG